MCQEQTAVSHSTTEADIISLDAGLRMEELLLNSRDCVVYVLAAANAMGNCSKVTFILSNP